MTTNHEVVGSTPTGCTTLDGNSIGQGTACKAAIGEFDSHPVLHSAIDTTISGGHPGKSRFGEQYSDVSGPRPRAVKRRPRERRSSELYVTDCICFKKKIDDIVSKAMRLKLTTMRDVCKIVRCGTKCGLCRPHIKARMNFSSPGEPPLPQSASRCGEGARVIPY